MIVHELKIGQRIYDIHTDRWGEVLLINGKVRDAVIDDPNTIISYKPDDDPNGCNTFADYVYPVIDGVDFQGNALCQEIRVDEFDWEHDYDYYCPDRDENFWDFEVKKKCSIS